MKLLFIAFALAVAGISAEQQQQQLQQQQRQCQQQQHQQCGTPANACQQSDDVQLLQRSSVRAGMNPDPMQQSLSNRSATVAAVLAEYDCNFDGVDDCGEWDYAYAMCKNQESCSHQYKFPDGTLDQSCRCKLCEKDPANQKSAFADLNLRDGSEGKFDALYWGSFRNWADHMSTCAPWLMPKDDDGIRSLLTYATANGYKVRISGAGHSSGGIVTDGENNEVFVISLAEYVAPDEWEFSMSSLPDGSKRAKVNAGWSQANLYQKIRPQGFFVPAQTAGYFFALGGIVANSVHGGSYLHSFQHAYTTKMRVMTYDGQIKIIDTEEELRYWRCSFGMLGIILGIEYQLEKRDQLQMYDVFTKHANGWNEEEFWRIIVEEAEADLPPEVVPVAGLSGSRKAWNGEYFIDFISQQVDTPRIMVYAQKANSSVDADFKGELGIPEDIATNYEKLLSKTVESRTGHKDMSWGQAARRDGAPPTMVGAIDANDMVGGLRGPTMAKIMSGQAIEQMPGMIKKQMETVNDGFYLVDSPAALASSYFIKPEFAFKAMDKLRTVQLASLKNEDFQWNLPGEFRFINVTDSAILQPVPAGVWFNAQPISFPDFAKNVQDWRKEFFNVDEYYREELGAKPHMGKLYGFGVEESGEVAPFQDSYLCTIYSDAQKKDFDGYRKTQDPEGLFATGMGIRLLQPCKP